MSFIMAFQSEQAVNRTSVWRSFQLIAERSRPAQRQPVSASVKTTSRRTVVINHNSVTGYEMPRHIRQQNTDVWHGCWRPLVSFFHDFLSMQFRLPKLSAVSAAH